MERWRDRRAKGGRGGEERRGGEDGEDVKMNAQMNFALLCSALNLSICLFILYTLSK